MSIVDNYKKVLDSVNEATLKSGRDIGDVRLLPISKTVDALKMVELAKIDVKTFGESRQQDASNKLVVLSNSGFKDIHIEFIGRLQKNKIRKIVEEFSLIHSVDSIDMANKISDVALGLGITKDILIQINPAKEAQKGGVYIDELNPLVEFILSRVNICLRGFMLIPPIDDINGRNNRYFVEAKRIFDRYSKDIRSINVLSMGMSDDFDIAIAEGSTVVRVGSLIFS